MQEPAPKGIVVVDKENHELATKIADSVTQAGIPTKVEAISPDPLHILKRLEGVVDTGAEIIGSNTPDFDRLLHGEGSQTGVKTAKGRSWLKTLRVRTSGLSQDKKVA